MMQSASHSHNGRKEHRSNMKRSWIVVFTNESVQKSGAMFFHHLADDPNAGSSLSRIHASLAIPAWLLHSRQRLCQDLLRWGTGEALTLGLCPWLQLTPFQGCVLTPRGSNSPQDPFSSSYRDSCNASRLVPRGVIHTGVAFWSMAMRNTVLLWIKPVNNMSPNYQ